MSNTIDNTQLDWDTRFADIVARILWVSATADSSAGLLEAVLAALPESVALAALAVAAPSDGQWNLLHAAGHCEGLPWDGCAEASDGDETVILAPWHFCPLSRNRILVLRSQNKLPAESVETMAAALAAALTGVQHREARQRQIHRLETILEIAHRWNQTHDMEQLLVQMAESATQLFGADRASIFLWDRPNRLLVGRPALGVDGDELRIPDDKGIVGQVIETGEPRRVNVEGRQEEIDRQVDSKLGYQTQTLLCVPLRGSDGELFGAFELINKLDGNFTDNDEAGLIELASHAAVALENTQEREGLVTTQRHLSAQAAEGINLIGNSPVIEALQSTIGRVADTDLAILILGENGTGKEVVARTAHFLSRRCDQPFIAINCAAIAETLLESELFGHEKGAFTDAHEARAGKFELASGGTLFLDEIGDLSLGGQAKLLRVLEEKVVVRVGGSTTIHTDARVIAATNQNLAEMVREKRFREDLYFRLNVVTLELPPLRDRGDDVIMLAHHFLEDFCQRARRRTPKFTSAARSRLLGHSWPGNVRELRNLMERLAYLSQGDTVDAEDLAFILSPGDKSAAIVDLGLPLSDATNQFQIDYIQKAIKRSGGNMSDAATKLGLHRSNLYRKMRQLEMESPKS